MDAENTTTIGRAPASWLPRRFGVPRNSLTGQITLRISSGLLVLWAAITLSFISVHLAPGDIVSILIGEQLRA